MRLVATFVLVNDFSKAATSLAVLSPAQRLRHRQPSRLSLRPCKAQRPRDREAVQRDSSRLTPVLSARARDKGFFGLALLARASCILQRAFARTASRQKRYMR